MLYLRRYSGHKLPCIHGIKMYWPSCGVTYVTVNAMTLKRGRVSASRNFTSTGISVPLDARI